MLAETWRVHHSNQIIGLYYRLIARTWAININSNKICIIMFKISLCLNYLLLHFNTTCPTHLQTHTPTNKSATHISLSQQYYHQYITSSLHHWHHATTTQSNHHIIPPHSTASTTITTHTYKHTLQQKNRQHTSLPQQSYHYITSLLHQEYQQEGCQNNTTHYSFISNSVLYLSIESVNPVVSWQARSPSFDLVGGSISLTTFKNIMFIKKFSSIFTIKLARIIY